MERSKLRSELLSKFRNRKEKSFYTDPVMIVGPMCSGKKNFVTNLFDGKEVKWVAEDDTELLSIDLGNEDAITSYIGSSEVLVLINGQKRDLGKFISALRITPPYPFLVILEDSLLYFYAGGICNNIEGLESENMYYFLPELWSEKYSDTNDFGTTEAKIKERLRFGFYPDVLNESTNREAILDDLVNSCLLNPILDYPLIRKGRDEIYLLLVELAKSIGKEISFNELQGKVGVDKNTISVYIEHLEESFIIRRMICHCEGIVGEKKQLQKFYFLDLGIRNAIVEDFRPIEKRNDSETNALWQNFILSEMWKKDRSMPIGVNAYRFWQLNKSNFVDLVPPTSLEKKQGFVFSWSKAVPPKVYEKFEEHTGTRVEVIDPQNFRNYI